MADQREHLHQWRHDFDNIENDCPSGRYEPARGITNLSKGDATIFIDQTIGID